MLDRKYLAELKRQVAEYESGRREVIKLAGDALNAAKRSIFALHRDDAKQADALLAESEKGLDAVRKLIKRQSGLQWEGSFRAALEEFTEASLYRQYLAGDVGAVEGDYIDYETYLGAFSDLTGEVQRRQVRLATEGKLKGVADAKEFIEAAVGELLEMDLGGHLRNKFDQAKNNLRRAEEVLYELSIRRK